MTIKLADPPQRFDSDRNLGRIRVGSGEESRAVPQAVPNRSQHEGGGGVKDRVVEPVAAHEECGKVELCILEDGGGEEGGDNGAELGEACGEKGEMVLDQGQD